MNKSSQQLLLLLLLLLLPPLLLLLPLLVVLVVIPSGTKSHVARQFTCSRIVVAAVCRVMHESPCHHLSRAAGTKQYILRMRRMVSPVGMRQLFALHKLP